MAERTVFAATDTAEVHTADRHAAFGRALTADVQAYRQQRGTHAPPAYWLKAGGLVAAQAAVLVAVLAEMRIWIQPVGRQLNISLMPVLQQ